MRILLALAAAFPASAFASGTTALGPCPPGFVQVDTERPSGSVTITEGAHGAVGCMSAPPLRAAEPTPRPSPFPTRDFREPMPVDASVLRLVSLNPRSPTALAQETSTRVILRTYDDFDRVKTELVPLEDGGTAQIRYTYWRNGVRKTMTDAFGRVTFYEYDGKNRLSRVTANQGLADEHVTTYTYWPDDLLKTITAPNGTVTSYGYDLADRVTSIDITRESVPLLSYAYTYDANGNRLSQIETNGGVPELTTYTYDQRDRLVTVTYPSGASVEYGYDAVGNRISEIERDPSGTIVSDKTAVFDAINRLSSVTDSADASKSATFTYDANGNLLTKTTAAGTETYDYDPRDLMVEARSGTAILARYAYDAFGRRYLKVSSEGAFVSVVRQYLYDQTSLLHELDESDLEVAKYEYGGDRLASLVRRDEPRRFYHQDALGSVVALSDSAGAVVARYHLDAWGRYRAPSELDASANRFGFTGYLFDQETELYYAKARFYDPEYGRFTSQDSVLGEIGEPPSLHRYFYGYANPLMYVDPTGHAVVNAARLDDVAEHDLGVLSGFDPALARPLLFESPAALSARDKVRSDTHRAARAQEGAEDRLVRLIELSERGASHYAEITIEESDLDNGQINRSAVRSALAAHVGEYAFYDEPTLESRFADGLQGARAGDTFDISEFYSGAYQLSERHTLGVANQPGTGPFPRNMAIVGQGAFGPRELRLDAGTELAQTSGDLVVAAVAVAGAARNLMLGARALLAPATEVANGAALSRPTLSQLALHQRINARTTEARLARVASQSFEYEVGQLAGRPGMGRARLGKLAEVRATRTLRRYAEHEGIPIGEGGLRFQVQGESSVPDVLYDPARQLLDFKLTPKAIRPGQAGAFRRDFPGYDLRYIFGGEQK